MRRDDDDGVATPPPDHDGTVTVTLVTICGHTCPIDLTPAERAGDARSLYDRAAAKTSIHTHRVKLLYKGRRIIGNTDTRNETEKEKKEGMHISDLPYGARIMTIPYPPPTTNSIKGAADGGDDLDTWTWFIKHKWRTTPTLWKGVTIAWLAGGPILTRVAPSVAPMYVIVSLITAIFLNLGTRKEGEMSAYSVFNKGMRRLPGQLTADDIDDAVRRGQI